MIQPQRFRVLIDQFKRHSIDTCQDSQAGFSLTDVLVAILLITTFVAVAMQGMVVAMLLKSKSLQVAEANQLVQTDLEGIRSKIALSQLPLGVNQPRCQPMSVDLGFADLIRDILAESNVTGLADYELSKIIATSKTGKTFQIARTLRIPQTPDNIDGKVLGIEYVLNITDGVKLEPPIFHFYTEVMPDAALQCQ